MHHIILPKTMSDHLWILLQMGPTHAAKRPFKFENVWLNWVVFVILLKRSRMIPMLLVLLALSWPKS